ncbi:hypothetical protein AB0J83_34460 [Actinoplanes sp. NPDC049596]|uniref:hypothetical protein n=1 Tax=unclassified Actinoplanes TaxID=2626549 RepID=UPI00343EE6C9
MSVFRAANNNPSKPRDPYPINPSTRDEAPDGPTEKLGRPARPKPRRNWALLLVAGLALFALNVAAVAVFVAWRTSQAARPASAPAPTGEGFDVTYAQEPLKVQVGCSAVIFLDLDEPRADADEKTSDLRYDSRCGTGVPNLTLGPGARAGAQVPGSDTDAAGCDRAIRTAPLGPGAAVPVRKGTVLCVLTAGAPAKMALVEITEVGTTGTAGMRATSWKVAG